MVNTITKTTLIDGQRNLVVLVSILGDGSGDETNTAIVTRNAFAPTDTELVVEKISGHLSGFTARLIFDATTKLTLAQMPDGYRTTYDYCGFGGISSNKAGVGAVGNLLISTTGLGAGEGGTFVLEMRKT